MHCCMHEQFSTCLVRAYTSYTRCKSVKKICSYNNSHLRLLTSLYGTVIVSSIWHTVHTSTCLLPYLFSSTIGVWSTTEQSAKISCCHGDPFPALPAAAGSAQFCPPLPREVPPPAWRAGVCGEECCENEAQQELWLWWVSTVNALIILHQQTINSYYKYKSV